MPDLPVRKLPPQPASLFTASESPRLSYELNPLRPVINPLGIWQELLNCQLS